ncbi:MAG TPA: metallophosphoesterase family protein [Vicinamibacterales bacterium]|jgi:predicted phosphodiesterase|nr:metallophosphoesterase family protein [Vicinamibacterales bacterium]
MRVAVLNDIHGNLPALEAVLKEVRAAGVDRIVVGGDVVPGPMTREVLACLTSLELRVEFLYGNGETAVLGAMAGTDDPRVPEIYRPMIRWTAHHLQTDYGRLLESWPKTLHRDIGGLGDVLFCHGTPRDDNEVFTKLTPDEVVRPMFEGVTAPLVVCGHTHMQFDRMLGDTRVVNTGSVGMPFGDAGADWLLLGPSVELRHTNYDLAQAAERIRATDYPDAESFASRYVLNRPTEAQMLEAFTAASVAKKR